MSASATSEPARDIFLIEVADTNLEFRSVNVADPLITGAQILSSCDASPRESYVVLQWLASGDIEEVREDELVEIKGQAVARFIVSRSDRLFRLVLNDRSLSWPDRRIDESALRQLGNIPEAEKLFIRREDVADEPIQAGATLDLGEGGVEVIYSKAEAWKLNVQGVVISSNEPLILVRDALTKAGFNPDQGWIIVLKSHDGKRQVGLDEVIDLRAAGIEKLRLTPREINNGEAPLPGRAFALLPADEAGLTLRGHQWETIVDAGRRWLILRDVTLPAGFDQAATTIAIEVPTSYPMAELDMFYCWPPLNRRDGMPIPQTQVTERILGQPFQRWSRHRGPGSPWRGGIDNVITHLALVDAAILREVEP